MMVYVSGLVVNRDRLLLGFHRKCQAWLQPGGKITNRESIVTGFSRELEEETGVSGFRIMPAPCGVVAVCTDYSPDRFELVSWSTLRLHVPNIALMDNTTCPSPFLAVVNAALVDLFFVASVREPRVRLNPAEHEDLRWFSSHELAPPGINDSLLLRVGPAVLSLVRQNGTYCEDSTNRISGRLKPIPNRNPLLARCQPGLD